MLRKTEKGFTLIELMIVVAIIGILAAIAIPRFADLIRKSKEGATKGNLGAIRSALSIYYGENEGRYPGAAVDGAGTTISGLTPTYLDAMPTVRLGGPGPATPAHTNHPDSGEVTAYRDTGYNTKPALTSDNGQWGYWYNASGAGLQATYAGVFINCTGTDSKDGTIHAW